MRMTALLIAPTMLAWIGCQDHSGGAATNHAPYLQNVQQDSATVLWVDGNDCETIVAYGLTPGYGRVARGAVIPSGIGTFVHRAMLSGLAPGTVYHYRVIGDYDSSADATLTTAPAAETNFSFAVYGDAQSWNPDNPAEVEEPTRSMMTHMVKQERVDFVVTTGDLTMEADAPCDVHNYFLARTVAIIGSRVPFYIAWGNHERDPGALIRRFVDQPSRFRSGAGPGYGGFAYEFAGCRFLCVDDYFADAEVKGWLREELRSKATRDARFTFVFIHRAPWYDRAYGGEDWLRTELVPELEQAHVMACFSGHVHCYERGFLNGVNYVTTGGGAWLDRAEPVLYDWPHILVGGIRNQPGIPDHGLVNEYMKVEVHGRSCTVKMLGFAPDGRYLGVLDSFQAESQNR